MCLIASKRMHPDNLPLIAKEDIEVYKGVKEVETYNKISFDIWMPVPYYIETGKQYVTPYTNYPVNFKNGKCELSTMFHYNEILYGYEPWIKYQDQDPYEVFDGIHSIFANSPKLMDMRAIPGIRIFDAIIPKGTKYYMGVEGDMVSERLIIYEQITIRDLMTMGEYFDKFVKRVD